LLTIDIFSRGGLYVDVVDRLVTHSLPTTPTPHHGNKTNRLIRQTTQAVDGARVVSTVLRPGLLNKMRDDAPKPSARLASSNHAAPERYSKRFFRHQCRLVFKKNWARHVDLASCTLITMPMHHDSAIMGGAVGGAVGGNDWCVLCFDFGIVMKLRL
jgi:hypothetical protein